MIKKTSLSKIIFMCQVQHTVVLHETNLSMFALLSVDREEGNLAIVHRESVPGGGYRSVMSAENIQGDNQAKYHFGKPYFI